MATLDAVCVVAELRPDAGTVGVTAIDKRPVAGAVKVGKLGVYADVQTDRKHHGGFEKAVYAYSSEDAAWWATELGRDLPPGWFGENLRITGLDVNAARVGEVWRIGEGERAVEVAVTMPRTPCMTFARWVGGDDARGWVKRFSNERRLGVYLSVVKTGTIAAGDSVTVVSVPHGAPGVLEGYRDPS